MIGGVIMMDWHIYLSLIALGLCCVINTAMFCKLADSFKELSKELHSNKVKKHEDFEIIEPRL